MVKQLTLVFSILLLASCASRKVDISKASVDIKTDSSSIVKVDSVLVKNNNVITVESADEVEYVAKDTSMPMVVDGKIFKNVIIRSKKVKKTTIDKTKAVAKVSSVKKLNVKREDKKAILDKHVKKEANYFIYLWILLIPIGMYMYRQIKKKILL